MSILILRRLVKRYRGGTITGSGTSNYIPMFTSNSPIMDEIKDREYAQPENEEE